MMKPARWLWMIASGALVAGCSGGGTSNNSANAGTGGVLPNGGAGSTGGSGTVGGAATGGGPVGTGCTGSFEQIENGLCIAKMVTIQGPTSGTDYQIDATEVTVGQYYAWLATNPALPPSTDENCGWMVDPNGFGYAVQAAVDAGVTANEDHHPVWEVHWCDAYWYCKSVGKRLCGAIGGGSAEPVSGYVDATVNQWYRACSSGGVNTYPYGNTYQAGTCDGPKPAISTVVVGSLSNCTSTVAGFTGVYDLSGNIREWEDSCGASGGRGYCRVRGGDFVSEDGDGMACNFADQAERSMAGYNAVGIRCCSI